MTSSSACVHTKTCVPGNSAIPERKFPGPEALRPRLTTGLPITGEISYPILSAATTVDNLRQARPAPGLAQMASAGAAKPARRALGPATPRAVLRAQLYPIPNVPPQDPPASG